MQKNICYFIVILLFFISTFKDTLTGYPFFSNYKIRVIDDIMIFALWGMMILDGEKKNIAINYRMINIFFMVFFVYFLIHNIILESSHYYNFLFFLRDNIWYLPIFFYTYKYESIKRRFDNTYILFFIRVQIIFVCFQIIYEFSKYGQLILYDDINGTLGFKTSHVISYLLILFVPWLVNKKKYLYLTCIFIILLLSSSRSTMIIYFFSLLIFILISKKINILKKISLIAIFMLLGLGVQYVYNHYTKNTLNLTTLFHQQTMRSIYIQDGANTKRISFLRDYTLKNMVDANKLLFGFGAGTYSSRSAMKMGGKYYNIFLDDFKGRKTYIVGGSTFNTWLGEYGLLGFLLLSLFFIFPIYIVFKDKLVFVSYLTIIIGLLFQKLFEEYSIAFFFWLMLAIYSYDINKKLEESKQVH